MRAIAKSGVSAAIALAAMTVSVALGAAQAADRFETSAGPVKVEAVVAGLDTPWAVAFLPGGALLLTQRDGRLLLAEPGRVVDVTGLPDIVATGQGGLLDVQVARDFAASGEIFLTYSARVTGGAATHLAVARLVDGDSPRLERLRVLFRQAKGSRGGRHFGSRVVEAPDGTLFLTIGDRGDADTAQATGRHAGKVIRIARDGSVPADNPFVGEAEILDEIWSLGHRNPQGAALDGAGRLWTVEHGAQGGDEINRPEAGRNYGWPVISYGRHYSGGKIGLGTDAPGMEQPVHYWDPSIAPSGLMVYSGKLWPEWAGDLFAGSLKFDMISRVDPESGTEERLFSDAFVRIRDVREGPDGAIWFLAEGDGVLYRVRPD